MKVLIIEDSEALRRGLSVGLNNLGFTVDETGDGSVGLTMALNQQYDLIVLDLMLPNVDGMSILRISTPARNSNQGSYLIRQDTTSG